MKISHTSFCHAPPGLVATGLLGWASFVLDGRLRIEVAVRRTRTGRHALSYPVRDDGCGRRWHLLRPVDDATRQELERQVLGAIDLEDPAA